MKNTINILFTNYIFLITLGKKIKKVYLNKWLFSCAIKQSHFLFSIKMSIIFRQFLELYLWSRVACHLVAFNQWCACAHCLRLSGMLANAWVYRDKAAGFMDNAFGHAPRLFHCHVGFICLREIKFFNFRILSNKILRHLFTDLVKKICKKNKQ